VDSFLVRKSGGKSFVPLVGAGKIHHWLQRTEPEKGPGFQRKKGQTN